MDINSFMESFKENLLNLFNDNLLFLGLQGSYGRGEAKESSDIDPVIILRHCGKAELLRYRSYIDTLPEKDILCGFVSSSDELRTWESADRASSFSIQNHYTENLPRFVLKSPMMILSMLYFRVHVQSIMHPHTTYCMQETGRFFQNSIRVQGSR